MLFLFHIQHTAWYMVGTLNLNLWQEGHLWSWILGVKKSGLLAPLINVFLSIIILMLLTCIHIPPDNIVPNYEDLWHFVCPEILSCIHHCQEIIHKQREPQNPTKEINYWILWNSSNKSDMTFPLKESLDIFIQRCTIVSYHSKREF